MSVRRSLLGVAAVALAAALSATGPGHRLANVDGDGRGPLYDRPLDDRSLRRAGEIVPDDATYYLESRTVDGVLHGNLKAATQLYLAPALPVLDSTTVDWVIVRAPGGRVRAVRRP